MNCSFKKILSITISCHFIILSLVQVATAAEPIVQNCPSGLEHYLTKGFLDNDVGVDNINGLGPGTPIEWAMGQTYKAYRELSSIASSERSSNAHLYEALFGDYTAQRYNSVMSSYKKMYETLRDQVVTFDCTCPGFNSLAFNEWPQAFILKAEPYKINICKWLRVDIGNGTPLFSPSLINRERDTKLIIHEMSHFSDIADTEDFAPMGETGSTITIDELFQQLFDLARDNPSSAIKNAETYARFTQPSYPVGGNPNNPYLPGMPSSSGVPDTPSNVQISKNFTDKIFVSWDQSRKQNVNYYEIIVDGMLFRTIYNVDSNAPTNYELYAAASSYSSLIGVAACNGSGCSGIDYVGMAYRAPRTYTVNTVNVSPILTYATNEPWRGGLGLTWEDVVVTNGFNNLLNFDYRILRCNHSDENCGFVGRDDWEGSRITGFNQDKSWKDYSVMPGKPYIYRIASDPQYSHPNLTFQQENDLRIFSSPTAPLYSTYQNYPERISAKLVNNQVLVSWRKIYAKTWGKNDLGFYSTETDESSNGYVVLRCPNQNSLPTNCAKLATVGANTTSFLDASSTSYNRFHYRIFACEPGYPSSCDKTNNTKSVNEIGEQYIGTFGQRVNPDSTSSGRASIPAIINLLLDDCPESNNDSCN